MPVVHCCFVCVPLAIAQSKTVSKHSVLLQMYCPSSGLADWLYSNIMALCIYKQLVELVLVLTVIDRSGLATVAPAFRAATDELHGGSPIGP